MRSLYRLDPEIAAALAPLAAKAADAPPIERGDWRALRERANANLTFLGTLNPPVSAAVQVQRLRITVDDGTDITARWYKRGNERPGSASVSYAQQLAAAEVPIELHVHPGAPHGFERFAPASELARRAMRDRLRVIKSI